MTHAAIKVHRVAGLQQHRGIKLGVEHHRTFQHHRELLATVTQEFTELRQRARLGLAEDGHHLLVKQLGRRVHMSVIGCIDHTTLAAAGQAAPS